MRRGFSYERISDDREGLALGVGRQREDNEELAAKHGIEIVAYFRDNDRGASTRSKKPRPHYAEMLRRAAAGECDVILAYSNSRLTRRPRELEDLIDLYEKHGVQFITKVSGTDDLSTADGRMVARIKGNVDTAEAERIGERGARKHLDLARQGAPVGGRRTFGWLPDKLTLDPIESELARKAVREVIAGRTLTAIVNEWNAAGVKTVMGGEWKTSTLRQYLVNPRLVGDRVLNGEVYQGAWTPLLGRDDFDRVCAVLKTPETRSRVPRRGSRHYLLTGLARCGVCNAPMYGNAHSRGFNYACNERRPYPHNNAASGLAVDRLMEKLLIARLAEEELADAAPESTWSGEPALRAAEQQIEELMAAYKARQISGARVFPMVEALEAEVAEMQQGRAEWILSTTGPALSRITPETWSGWSVAERRAALERVLSAVLIRPSPTRRANRLDPERVDPVWREEPRGLHAVPD